MARIRLGRISGGYDVPGFGTVARAAMLRPSKTLCDTEGRTYRVAARARSSTVTDASGAQLGIFRRSFWTRHGTLEWRERHYDFRAGIWSSTYELTCDAQPVVTVRLKALGASEVSVEGDVDPVLVLTTLALALITRSYAGAAAAA